VRYEETDQGGVVYHANYFRYLEAVRVELMRFHGISYADYERSGIRLMVVEASSRFHSPAAFDDLLRVTVTNVDVGPVRLDLQYKIHRLDPAASPSRPGYSEGLPDAAALVVSARTLLANVHPDGRPCRLPSHLRERLKGNS
jgi:acyl-CoA thioester hydrolase